MINMRLLPLKMVSLVDHTVTTCDIDEVLHGTIIEALELLQKYRTSDPVAISVKTSKNVSLSDGENLPVTRFEVSPVSGYEKDGSMKFGWNASYMIGIIPCDSEGIPTLATPVFIPDAGTLTFKFDRYSDTRPDDSWVDPVREKDIFTLDRVLSRKGKDYLNDLMGVFGGPSTTLNINSVYKGDSYGQPGSGAKYTLVSYNPVVDLHASLDKTVVTYVSALYYEYGNWVGQQLLL